MTVHEKCLILRIVMTQKQSVTIMNVKEMRKVLLIMTLRRSIDEERGRRNEDSSCPKCIGAKNARAWEPLSDLHPPRMPLPDLPP